MRLNFLFLLHLALTCTSEIPLVNGPAPIPDAQITASSSWGGTTLPQYARLNSTAGAGAWCPGYDEINAPTLNMYIQVGIKRVAVEFGDPMKYMMYLNGYVLEKLQLLLLLP